ncbi:L-2,4-diaminobutyrate decarboxylase [Alteribacillus persepolensis]|uniref:L-2,4-diaminobutyrate decarboxylase n=1 Tax=Alteribacillus persepolensis TaxID=568899 RepID=A0A1G8FPE3_9BACI|nr:aspartate aminotransferase family protein [Alteribacillus persepolensis]SDH83796.1 L-2,4-diaminobutyrate decarboxylase [Alteribacillus persepolensis]
MVLAESSIAPEKSLEHFFIGMNTSTNETFQKKVDMTVQMLTDTLEELSQPYIGLTPEQMHSRLKHLELSSVNGQVWEQVLQDIKKYAVDPAVNVYHPKCMAHLQCPAVLPSVAADLIISALNQSMDSWDQSPAATYIEERLIKYLLDTAGMPETGDGVFTSGGTQSNYMGLQLARDIWCKNYLSHSVQLSGLPKEASRFRLLCSEEAHFTVKKSAAQLGLGEKAVVTVPTNQKKEIDIPSLKKSIELLKKDGLLPIVVVATAGNTDFGSIDSLHEIADIAAAENMWYHVDAAYGGGLFFSQKHAHRLKGIERADSVAVDFHKMLFQSVSCGVFLVKQAEHLAVNNQQAVYLNPKEDETAGNLHLVGKSVQTSRRFDALKLLMTFKHVGINTLGQWIDELVDITNRLYEEISKYNNLEAAVPPSISTIVFRYVPTSNISTEKTDEINRRIKEELFFNGEAALSKTKVQNRQYLKITILHPDAEIAARKKVIASVIEKGKFLEERSLKDE